MLGTALIDVLRHRARVSAMSRSRGYSPRGVEWDAAVRYWSTLHSDADAKWDCARHLAPRGGDSLVSC